MISEADEEVLVLHFDGNTHNLNAWLAGPFNQNSF